MKVVIDAKTKEIIEEEYTPPKKTKAQQKEERIAEIQNELNELDNIIKRPLEDVIEKLHIETGYVPYSTTAEVINHKEDLRDELQALKQTNN